MKAIIREIDKGYYKERFETVPQITYDIEKCEVPEDVNIIVHNVIAIEQTKDKLIRVCFGHNKIHPYQVELSPAYYYQIEIF